MKTSLMCVWVAALVLMGLTGCSKPKEEPVTKVPVRAAEPAKKAPEKAAEPAKDAQPAKPEHPKSEHPAGEHPK